MRCCFLCLLSLLLTFAMSAQEQTLRVDYMFSGTDRSVEISLDEMSHFDGWAGRRTNLDKVPVRGNGQICMTDAQTDNREDNRHHHART